MANTSLLEKEGPVTLEDLKANFLENDFSTYSSGFNDKYESVQRTQRFEKIREYFETAWNEQLKVLTGKSMQNFTEHSAVGSLEKSEGNLIAGTLVDVLENEQQTEILLWAVAIQPWRPTCAVLWANIYHCRKTVPLILL